MRIRYLLNGQPCNPVNRNDIYLEVNHDQGAIINQDHPHVGVNNLYFAREDIKKIMSWLNNPPGVTEGIPFDIEVTEDGTTEVINFFINCMDGFKRSNDGIEASVKLMQSLDWLEYRVQQFTFESMYNEGPSSVPIVIDSITYASYQEYFDKRCIFIPYVISTVPNYQTAFTATFSLIYIGTQIYSIIKAITQWAAPLPGVWVAVPIAQLVLEIAYVILLVLALLVLVNELINSLIQPIKYHGAMLIVDLLKITAHKCGLKFQSTIWTTFPYNQIAYLPEKFNPLQDVTPLRSFFTHTFQGFAPRGFTSPGYATSAVHNSATTTIQKGYFNGDGGTFLRFVKSICNGKIIIPDQTTDMVLERRDFYPPGTPFKLQDVRQDWNGWNTDEMSATIILQFLSDLNDKNCIDFVDASGNPFYPGTILQATTQQTVVNDVLKICLSGQRNIQINAARGAAKDQLNFIENSVAVLEQIWNATVTVLDTIANFYIVQLNVYIAIVNFAILIWNGLMTVVAALINFVNNIWYVITSMIGAISSLFGGSNTPNPALSFNGSSLMANPLPFITLLSPQPAWSMATVPRVGALLLENDMVDTPKLLLVDTGGPAFNGIGGYSGKRRIAYIHPANRTTVNAQKLWTDFYAIDAFVGSPNNRFTKIAPENNHESEENPTTMRLADFKNLVSNPKFKDNFNEDVISETIQWYLEKNGRALLHFRKSGWLADPQNPNGTKRHTEININLNLALTLPNGQ